VIFVRFPPRLVLAASALGMVAASSGAVLLMPDSTEPAAVPVPEITSPEQQAQAPAEPIAAPAPAITGAQIAELALGPARDRAAALIEEQTRAEAQERAERRADDDDRWDELREEIREACDDGRIRGQICRSG
jgi:hypothetical protein